MKDMTQCLYLTHSPGSSFSSARLLYESYWKVPTSEPSSCNLHHVNGGFPLAFLNRNDSSLSAFCLQDLLLCLDLRKELLFFTPENCLFLDDFSFVACLMFFFFLQY